MEALGQNHSMDRAITLGVLAWRIAPTPEAEGALQKLQRTTSELARILGQHTAEITHLAFSGDSSVLATAAEDGSTVLWTVSDWRPIGTVLPDKRDIEGLMLDWTGAHLLAACSSETRTRIATNIKQYYGMSEPRRTKCCQHRFLVRMSRTTMPL